MKKQTLLLAILLAAGLTSSWAQDTWTQKANFGGTERFLGVGFSIGSKGYVGTGAPDTTQFLKDFWEYDPITNAWTQKADFGGTARYGAVGFSIGSKGYVGTGRDTTFQSVKDFWEYDPITNAWTQKADFGGTATVYAVGFSIGSRGYVGTGAAFPHNSKDFWEYDPSTNTWTQKAHVGGAGRVFAVGFSIGSRGYIGTGWDNFAFHRDFWEYDPITNAWTQKADLRKRGYAVGFSIGSKGYIGTGTGSAYLKDFWEYDPATNAWTQKADFGGTARLAATGFSIGSKGYLGTGQDDSGFVNDFWEYTPDGGGGGLTLTSAASRRAQGGQTFDINLPLSGTSGVEPRSGANEFIIFTFSNNVTAVDGATSSCGTVVSTTIDSSDAHNVIVQSNGACNQQDVILTLNGVHDDQGNTLASAAVTIGVLYGDVDGDRRITRADQDQIKAHRGQTVDGSNFLNDINRSGVIDANDLLAVRQQRGNRLP
jgi:N-acetylneuraminic acid mutarotase